MKKNARLIIAAIIAIFVIIVVLQNMAPAPTRILFITIEMPRAVLLLLTLAIGFVLGLLFAVRPKRYSKTKPANEPLR